MSGLAVVPRPGYSVVAWWKRVAAILVTLGLAVTVVWLGIEPLPLEHSPLKLRWEFANPATPLWPWPKGRVQRTPQGLVVSSQTEPAWLTSGRLDPVKGLGRFRARLNVQEPSEGRIALTLQSSIGTQRHIVFPFHSRGGGVFEDIVVPLKIQDAADVWIDEVRLLPSVIPQTVVVASVVLEPDASFLETAVKELFSPLPGELMSTRAYSIHQLVPSVIDGRSAWMVLIPIVLLAGTIARLSSGNPRVRRWAWGMLGTVWGLGFALLVYHQTVAVALDTQRYEGLSRDDAYAVYDQIPLSQDMREVAQLVPPRTTVEFGGGTDQETPPASINWEFWRLRANYYLVPILVRPSAPVRVHYFIDAHPPCAQVEPEKSLLHEAARFCLFRTQE